MRQGPFELFVCFIFESVHIHSSIWLRDQLRQIVLMDDEPLVVYDFELDSFFLFFLSVVMTLFLFLFCFFFLFSFFLQTLYRMFSKVDFQSGFRPYHCSIYSWYIFWVEFAPAVWLSRTVFYRELFKLFFFNANDGKWHFSIAHPFDLWSWDAIVGHVTGHQYAIVRDRYCDAAPNLLQIYLSCWKQSSVALP